MRRREMGRAQKVDLGNNTKMIAAMSKDGKKVRGKEREKNTLNKWR